MKINPEVLKQLSPTFGVSPVSDPAKAFAPFSEKAPSKYEPILTGNGYDWSDEASAYVQNDQVIYYLAQKNLFVWIWDNSLARPFQGTDTLTKWVQGNEKYPEGKANAFMGTYKQLTGQGEEGGVAEPESDPESGDIKVTGTGSRPDDFEPKPVDPVDALIAQAKKKMSKSGAMKSDDIIDLYRKAKDLKSNKLMTFVKTIHPMGEGTIKQSQLQEIIRHIVRGVVKEAAVGNFKDPDDDEVLALADKTWGEPGGKQWRIANSRNSQYGTVWQVQVTHPISRFVWKTKDGKWKVLDPKTKKWSDVEGPSVPAPSTGSDELPTEQSMTAAAGPVTGPAAFSKKKPMEEMTTTSGGGGSSAGTVGYNVPGFLSKKGGSAAGVKGSEKLGYTLTPAGKVEMQRSADKLYEDKKK